jgi:hypothetical protein
LFQLIGQVFNLSQVILTIDLGKHGVIVQIHYVSY